MNIKDSGYNSIIIFNVLNEILVKLIQGCQYINVKKKKKAIQYAQVRMID